MSQLLPYEGAVGPGRHDKEGRKHALVEAALQTFAERGYEASTTREIADLANCSEGLIHRYFGGKRGLLWAALDEKQEGAAMHFDDAVQAADSLDEAIEAALLHLCEMFSDRQQLFRVVMSRCMVDEADGIAFGERIREKQSNVLEQSFQGLKERGLLDPSTDVEALAEAVRDVGFMVGFMQQVVFAAGTAFVRERIHAIAQILAHGAAHSGN